MGKVMQYTTINNASKIQAIMSLNAFERSKIRGSERRVSLFHCGLSTKSFEW
jgi:hypothetical protein